MWPALIGLALSEGLMLGVCMSLPVLGNSEQDRKEIIKPLVPLNLSNLAWLIALVAITFSAWPVAYAVTFASFYPLLFLISLASLFRPIALYGFSANVSDQWQQYVRKVLSISGLIPAALLGLLAGNLLKGIPFHLESDMQIRFLGDFWGLFNLFSILVTLTCLALLAMYGAVFLQLRTCDEMQQNARAMVIRTAALFLVFFAMTGLWITHLEGYHISSEILPDAASNPLAKFVKRGEGLWLDNYEHLPELWIIPALAFIGGGLTLWFAKSDKTYWAMLASVLSVIMVVLTFGISMFPFLVPSNISLNSSLTVWDSSASELNLRLLLWVAICALPLMAVCSRWLFRVFADEAKQADSIE